MVMETHVGKIKGYKYMPIKYAPPLLPSFSMITVSKMVPMKTNT
jgi:hypothetical protein